MSTEPTPKFEQVSNALRVPIVRRDGTLLEEVTYRNTIFPFFHPEDSIQDLDADKGKAGNYPLIIVAWGIDTHNKRVENITPSDIAETVTFNGSVYLVDRYSGTSVKQQRTLGVRADIVPFFQPFIRLAEQSTKVNRAALPMGAAAYKATSDINVLYVPDGWEYGNLVIDDGFAIIADDLLPEYTGVRVHYKYGNQNLQVWQDVLFNDDAKSEAQAIIDTYYQSRGKLDIAKEVWEKTDLYKRLIAACPLMERHPYTIQRISNQHKDWFCARLTSLPLTMYLGVAAPLPKDIPYLPAVLKPGVYLQHRYPKTAPLGSTISVVGEITPRMQAFYDHLKSREGFQATLTTKRESWKFVAMRVPRELMPAGVDIITSVSNLKLDKNRAKAISDKIEKQGVCRYLMDKDDLPVLSIIQYYSHGSFVGVSMQVQDENGNFIPNSWKAKSGDVDGDNVFEVDLSDYPAIAQAFADSYTLHKIAGMKAKKSKTDVARTKFLLANAFLAGRMVGLWTNLRSWYLALPEELRQEAAGNLDEQNLLEDHEGKRLPVNHDGVLQMFADRIQECVDAPKSITCDMWDSQRKATAVQGVLGAFSKAPGWNHFRRSQVAGALALPMFEEEMPEWMLNRMRIDKDFRKSDPVKDMTPTLMQEGTIGWIMKQSKPYLAKIFEKNIGDEALPLSEFAGWAGVVRKEWVDLAEGAFFDRWAEFDAQSKRMAQLGLYDVNDPEEVAARHGEWRIQCQAVVDERFHGDRTLAAKALWVAAHQTNRGMATAALVFVGFPDECLQIVSGSRREPGGAYRTILVGLEYHFGSQPPAEIVARVRVVERTDKPGRKAIVGDGSIPALKKDGGNGFPDWTIGSIASLDRRQVRSGFVVPELGSYDMVLKRDGRAYVAELAAAE